MNTIRATTRRCVPTVVSSRHAPISDVYLTRPTPSIRKTVREEEEEGESFLSKHKKWITVLLGALGLGIILSILAARHRAVAQDSKREALKEDIVDFARQYYDADKDQIKALKARLDKKDDNGDLFDDDDENDDDDDENDDDDDDDDNDMVRKYKKKCRRQKYKKDGKFKRDDKFKRGDKFNQERQKNLANLVRKNCYAATRLAIDADTGQRKQNFLDNGVNGNHIARWAAIQKDMNGDQTLLGVAQQQQGFNDSNKVFSGQDRSKILPNNLGPNLPEFSSPQEKEEFMEFLRFMQRQQLNYDKNTFDVDDTDGDDDDDDDILDDIFDMDDDRDRNDRKWWWNDDRDRDRVKPIDWNDVVKRGDKNDAVRRSQLTSLMANDEKEISDDVSDAVSRLRQSLMSTPVILNGEQSSLLALGRQQQQQQNANNQVWRGRGRRGRGRRGRGRRRHWRRGRRPIPWNNVRYNYVPGNYFNPSWVVWYYRYYYPYNYWGNNVRPIVYY